MHSVAQRMLRKVCMRSTMAYIHSDRNITLGQKKKRLQETLTFNWSDTFSGCSSTASSLIFSLTPSCDTFDICYSVSPDIHMAILSHNISMEVRKLILPHSTHFPLYFRQGWDTEWGATWKADQIAIF